MNTDDIKFIEKGRTVSYENMMINEWELRKDCYYDAIYPQISNISLFETDYKIEQISI